HLPPLRYPQPHRRLSFLPFSRGLFLAMTHASFIALCHHQTHEKKSQALSAAEGCRPSPPKTRALAPEGTLSLLLRLIIRWRLKLQRTRGPNYIVSQNTRWADSEQG